MLRSIDLRNNALSIVPADTFVNLPVLRSIYLSFNNIHTVEVGAFGHLPSLQQIRLDHNSIVTLLNGTFSGHRLPIIDLIRLRANPLTNMAPGTFNHLTTIRRIEMNGTLINSSHLGTFDIKTGTATVTAFPGCNQLRYLELGIFRLHVLSEENPDMKMLLSSVVRVGQQREIYTTDLNECDILSRSAMFNEDFGAAVCYMSNGNTLSDAPSRREKGHLN